MEHQPHTVCICGAGTMGTGIAQLVAQSGFSTLLFDLSEPALNKAKISIDNNLSIMVERKKLSADEGNAIRNAIRYSSEFRDCVGKIIIEAIIENSEAKIDLFQGLAGMNGGKTIYATNTSSLSVTGIAHKNKYSSRVVGMHFFNPAPVMRLVEIVTTDLASWQTVQSAVEFAIQLGKTPVLCKDAPGFIVNRVARPYYLEALNLLEQGHTDLETIDDILEATGFKMGPFRLMDLIGNDINLAVTRSVYNAFRQPARFKPSLIQEQKVMLGELGRKTGKGYYSYK